MTSTSGNLTLDELYAEANEFCRKWWGVDYTARIVIVNRRWKRRQAAFRWNRVDPNDVYIQFSRAVNAAHSREDVLGWLAHELVHWRLFTQGLPASDDAPEFVAECLRVGAPISQTQAALDAKKRYLAGGGAE